MSVPMIHQLPPSVRRWDVRSQYAALCYKRKGGKLKLLLVTSRKTNRWIIPKGWPIDGLAPAESALQEAWEEAGVIGTATDVCLGLFSYRKLMQGGAGLPCVAMVYPVEVSRLADTFPEAGERKRVWVSRKKAARMVGEPELARILKEFRPRHLR